MLHVAAWLHKTTYNPHAYLTMPACSSWWQPAVCVTCVSRESRAWIRWSCRGCTGGSEEARTL